MKISPPPERPPISHALPLAFDRKAASYDTHAHVQRDTAAWVAEWLPAPGTFSNCLELGAGTGNFTRHLATRFAHLEASDHAPAMIIQGRQTFPAVTWSQRDAWAAPEHPASVDFIASCSLLQWATDPVTVLARWRSLLVPGGRQLSGIYIAPSLPEFGILLPEQRPFDWRTAQTWRDCFTAAGFKVTRLESRTREYIYHDARALLRQLHGTGATVRSAPLPVGQLKNFLRRYDEIHRRPGGVLATWTFCRLEATA